MTRALFSRTLLLCALTTSTLCLSLSIAPSLAHAREPSALDKRDYDDAFRRLQRDVNDQITRKNLIYEETIKRERGKINEALARMTRQGVDVAPYQKEVDAFLEDARARLATQQAAKARDAIKKDPPSISPLPGVDAIKKGPPTWCASGSADFASGLGSIYDLPPSVRAVTLQRIQLAAQFSCALPDFDLAQQWTVSYRQHLSNLLGLSEKENEALLTFAASSYKKLEYSESIKLREHPRASLCASFPVKKTGLLEEQVLGDLIQGVFSCAAIGARHHFGDYLSFPGTPFWLVDIDGFPSSHIGRLAIAYGFLGQHLFEEDLATPSTSKFAEQVVNNYALASVIELDRASVLAEIEAMKLSKEDTWIAKIAALGALQNLAKARALLLDAAETDPGFKAVFLDGPRAGFEQFKKDAKGGKAALDLLLTLEDKLANDSADLSGCGEAVYAEFSPWLKAKVKEEKIKDYNDVKFNDYTGSLLLQSLVLCATHEAEQLPSMLSVFKDNHYDKIEIKRGPLGSAYQGMLSAYNDYRANPPAKSGAFSGRRGASSTTTKLKLDRIAQTPVMRPDLPPARKTYAMENPGTQPDLRGVIKTISKADGGRVRIEFKVEKYKSAIRDCKETGRIDRIDSNGRFVPEYSCRTTGYETLERTHDPVEIPAWLVDGLKPGHMIAYRATKAFPAVKQLSYAFPYAAYTSKKGDTLISIYGIKL